MRIPGPTAGDLFRLGDHRVLSANATERGQDCSRKRPGALRQAPTPPSDI